MSIQEMIIKKYPLTIKVDCELNCYMLAKKRYLAFWNSTIEKENIHDILKTIEKNTKNKAFNKWKTIIVFGYTNDCFKKSELFYFNNTDTLIVFYLVNKKDKKIFMNDSWIFILGLNYRKYIKKINKLVIKCCTVGQN